MAIGSRFPRMKSGHKLLRSCALGFCFSTALAAADLWTTAYYPAYHQAQMAPEEIDFSVVSHVIHFSIVPKADGSLDTVANGLTAARSADLVAHAHAAHRKALICVGGADSEAGFQSATSSANLPGFVNQLVSFMTDNGYDGVDLDWEPLTSADAGRYAALANALRTALDLHTPRPLLTVATASEPKLFASLQSQFDQINLMTYDLAGPWPGWVVWFNAPIYDGGYRFPSTGSLIPSADGLVTEFLGNRVSNQKLAIGSPSMASCGITVEAPPPGAPCCRVNPGRWPPQSRRWPGQPFRPIITSRKTITGMTPRRRPT